ncbi:MarR family transcriptional regulator [Halomonas sp. HP20-15]|uniref:MarR family winged helix-turn-helix transcriptional regulator n=1 Tax=Halomonas sp. HP20-15 TaxID=3085901 RepID=UPI0029826490|nr:MarR family transcriptional regulator [Halomonas sp. HP20-15]MDW5377608.1 MarR family transcriptional regulator [Halomonas sp. HP20-15]
MARSNRRSNNQETRTVLRHWQEDVPDDRLAHLVRDAGRVLTKSLQAKLADHSVSFGHWSFLRILWVTEGLTQRELSEQAGLMEPTTYTALKAMEANGLIERRQLNGNRKNIHIYLTEKGRDLKQILIPLAESVNDSAVRGVDDDDLLATRRTLLAIISNLAEANE